MRRSFSVITGAATASLFGLLMLTACIEGPEGPAGTTGATGETGATGAQGVAGSDANQNCTQCHDDDTDITVRQIQWEASVHATGGNFERGGSATCAACHTHEGFVDRIATGLQVASQGFDNPSPPNCRTCHQIHTTYSSADYNLTTQAPFDLWINDVEVDFGKGTLCAQCHQPRIPSPLPALGGADVTITSSYWGPHYGAQAAILGGTGAYELTGTETYPTSPFAHGDVATNADGCPTCHMATAFGDQAGGHTMKMEYFYHGADTPNTAGCETCHGLADTWSDFDYGSVQTDVDALIVTLKAKLETLGIMDATDHAIAGTWTADEAGALLNYILIIKDHSHGVHNPTYVKALLTNTIASLP